MYSVMSSGMDLPVPGGSTPVLAPSTSLINLSARCDPVLSCAPCVPATEGRSVILVCAGSQGKKNTDLGSTESRMVVVIPKTDALIQD